MDPIREEPRALDVASPRNLWLWAFIIAAAGVVLRLVWFQSYGTELINTIGALAGSDTWRLGGLTVWVDGLGNFNPNLAAKAFAPGYGAFLHAAWEYGGGDTHSTRVAILATQSLMVFASTLLTFALSRRVLFGYAALVPAALMTASVALLELPGLPAPQIPLMLIIVFAIWLITLLRERAPDLTGAGPVLLALGGGLSLGAGILFSPTTLLLVPFVLWWAFRGVGREHAVLLLVATILLPACWLAVAQTQISGGIPTDQIGAWLDSDGKRVVDSPQAAADRAYAVVTPWNPRFSRGAWESTNWNYEWLLPLSVRAETTYQSATRVLAAVLMIGYLLLVVAGAVALFAEGAGSAERLIALPAITMPFATFFTGAGGLLRVSVLPFLMICLVLGGALLLEKVRSGHEDPPFEGV